MNTLEAIRFDDLVPSHAAFIDANTPGSHLKKNYCIIGKGVSEDTDQFIHLNEHSPFHFGAAAQPPGIRNSLHAHTTCEIFIIYQGQFRVFFGNQGQHEVHLSYGDILSVPPGMFRGFEVIGDTEGFAFVVLGGEDAGGPLVWHPSVLQESCGHGLYLKKDGTLVNTHLGQQLPDEAELVKPFSSAEMARFKEFTLEELQHRYLPFSEISKANTDSAASLSQQLFGQAGTRSSCRQSNDSIDIHAHYIKQGDCLELAASKHYQLAIVMDGDVQIHHSGVKGSHQASSGDTLRLAFGSSHQMKCLSDRVLVYLFESSEPFAQEQAV